MRSKTFKLFSEISIRERGSFNNYLSSWLKCIRSYLARKWAALVLNLPCYWYHLSVLLNTEPAGPLVSVNFQMPAYLP